ncbi:hypothetical protein AB4097_03830 [Microvirga sp. 2MCAF35]|uniref:hypothetical protein n=1 Tax=Microvirga sp. 2MCAF35 TaxID=3232987 RepID=UPI003F99900F
MSDDNEIIQVDLSALSRERLEALCRYMLEFTDGVTQVNNRLLGRLTEDPRNAKVIFDHWSTLLNRMNEQLAAFVTSLVADRDGQQVQ